MFEPGMLEQYEGWLWLLLVLGPLLFIQRSLHQEIQLLLYLIFRRENVSLLVFSLLFLPGVFLHEASHFLTAKILRVRTGRFSLVPKPLPNGKLRLGFVETAPGGAVRDALIGLAPLLAGGSVVAWIGFSKMQVLAAADLMPFAAIMQSLPGKLGSLLDKPDIWLWFFLVFTVSSTMFPSASDRRAWAPVLIGVGLLLLAAVLIGAGPWIITTFSPTVNRSLHLAASVYALSLAVHVVLWIPVWGIRLLICRGRGIRLV
jgi:hypothetical protein